VPTREDADVRRLRGWSPSLRRWDGPRGKPTHDVGHRSHQRKCDSSRRGKVPEKRGCRQAS
jgi:hypothetical protein